MFKELNNFRCRADLPEKDWWVQFAQMASGQSGQTLETPSEHMQEL